MDNILEGLRIDQSAVDVMVMQFGKEKAVEEISAICRLWIKGIILGEDSMFEEKASDQ